MALDPTAITRGDTIMMEAPDGRRWSGQVQDVTHGPGGSYEITVTQTDAIPKAVRDLLEDPNDLERWRCPSGHSNPGVTLRCGQCGRRRHA